MVSVIEKVFIVVFIVLIVQWLSSKIRSASPKNETETSGTIAPEKISAWVTMILGAAIMLGSIAGLFFLHSSFTPAGLMVLGILFGGAILGFMSPSVTTLHELNWNENGVEGPSKTFGPTLGRTRAEIAWADIMCTGETATQYWYIEAEDGRRIYWSYLYKGHRAFEQVLHRQCPQLNV